MAMQTVTSTGDKQTLAPHQTLQRLREVYADAPEVGRVALEKIMGELDAAVRSQQKAATAGRVGLRQGKVSELTAIVNLTPGGAKRLRALLDVLGNNFQGADKVGTLHDITDRRRAEDEARQMQDRIAHFGRISTMGEMAAGIAHEVNQPLTAIATYAQACQRLIARWPMSRRYCAPSNRTPCTSW